MLTFVITPREKYTRTNNSTYCKSTNQFFHNLYSFFLYIYSRMHLLSYYMILYVNFFSSCWTLYKVLKYSRMTILSVLTTALVLNYKCVNMCVCVYFYTYTYINWNAMYYLVYGEIYVYGGTSVCLRLSNICSILTCLLIQKSGKYLFPESTFQYLVLT